MIEDSVPRDHDKRERRPLETMRPATAAAVLCPFVRGRGAERDGGAKLAEAVGLARAIDIDVRLAQIAPLRRVTPATLLGKGDYTDARAVGTACGQNPIAIIIPCHRVVGSNALGGYSSDLGLTAKRFLLDLEKGQGRLF